jgi:signal transduction histidine kinase
MILQQEAVRKHCEHRDMRRTPPTHQPQAEAVNPVLDDRLRELSAQFDLLRAQVRQAQQLASLGTAAAMLAHEVNNLLTPVRSYVESALASDDVEFMKKALRITAKNVHILTGMSARILEINAAKTRTPEPVPVRAVVDDAIASLCRDPAKDGIKLRIDVEPTLTAWVDPLQLQQVLFNLLKNAREAMTGQHGGRLTVSASRLDDHVAIEVHNTGEPIPRELLPQLFEPFQSSKPAENEGRTRCRGLGLTLCRDLIEENDGSISVASGPEPLTTFTIRLPANRPT